MEPLPARLTLCALPPLLSAMVNVEERGPLAEGLKVTGIRAVPPFAARFTGAVEVVEKSPVLAPEKVRPVICSAPAVLLVTVIGEAALLVPTA